GSVRAPVEDVRVVVDASGPEPEHLLEAVAGGRELLGRPEMPFAEQASAIAALPQTEGEGGLRRQARSTAAAAEDRLHTRMGGVLPGQQRGPGRGADRRVRVPARELHAVAAQRIQVRGGDVVGAEAAQVAPAEIIGIQDHDVRGSGSPHGRSFIAPGAARVLACAGPSPWEWGSGTVP